MKKGGEIIATHYSSPVIMGICFKCVNSKISAIALLTCNLITCLDCYSEVKQIFHNARCKTDKKHISDI